MRSLPEIVSKSKYNGEIRSKNQSNDVNTKYTKYTGYGSTQDVIDGPHCIIYGNVY